MRRVLALLIWLPLAAQAQTVTQPAATPAAMSAVAATIPQPAATIPSGGVNGGTSGSAATYPRSDAAPKITVQGANTTVGTNCAWSVTFTQAFISSTPIVSAHPVMTAGAAQPMTCIVTSRSTTAQSGTCYQAQTTLLSLSIVTSGLTVLPFQASACTALPLMVIAREPTQ